MERQTRHANSTQLVWAALPLAYEQGGLGRLDATPAMLSTPQRSSLCSASLLHCTLGKLAFQIALETPECFKALVKYLRVTGASQFWPGQSLQRSGCVGLAPFRSWKRTQEMRSESAQRLGHTRVGLALQNLPLSGRLELPLYRQLGSLKALRSDQGEHLRQLGHLIGHGA